MNVLHIICSTFLLGGVYYMKREYQALIDRDLKRLKMAKTLEEKKEASEALEATKSVINALMYNKEEMEKLS